MKDKLTYKDFETGKPKWTRGRFREWTEPTGLLNVRYAVIDRGRSTLYIPEYCLGEDAKRSCDYEMKCRAVPAEVAEAMPHLTKPTKPRKHLFGIVEKHNRKTGETIRYGYFLVATSDRCVTREAAKEMYIEANEEGINKPLNVYCACSCIAGAGLNIIQVEWN